MQLLEHIRKWYAFNSVIGVSACLDSEQGVRLVHIKRSQEGLSVIDMEELSDLEALQKYCSAFKADPVGLQLQGKGILLKTLPKSQRTNNSETDIQQVFPAYSAQEFYAFIHEGVDTCWIALVRRESLDKMVQAMLNKGINLVQIGIGPFVFDNILQQLNVYNRIYVFDGHRIETDPEGGWLSYGASDTNKAPFKTKIGTKHIEQDYLAAYAIAFQVLMGDFVTDFSIAQEEVLVQMDESRQRVQFKNNILLLLGAVFFLLVVSTFLFSYYHGENEQLESQVGQQQVSGEEVKDRGLKTDQYESQLKELGWNGGVSKAWLLDQVGSSLRNHESIQLTGIQINPAPVRKRGAQENTVDLRNTMVLSGRCFSLDGLNAWVRTLSNTKWVQRLHMVKFGKSQAYGDEAQVFQLEVSFGDEGNESDEGDGG